MAESLVLDDGLLARAPTSRRSPAIRVLRFARSSPMGAFAALMLLALFVSAVFADVIAQYSYDKTHVTDRLEGASGDYWLGTDGLGRDVFSRLVYGARVSLFVSCGAVAISITFGTILGLVSGFRGGVLDLAVQRIVDVAIAFPALIIAISVVAVFSAGLFTVAIILGVVMIATATRMVRGVTISLRQETYIEAARVLGASEIRIMLRHILPNTLPTIIVLCSLQMGAAILAESSLSFLGFGIPPPHPSWGSMLTTSARNQMREAPLLSLYPGIAITLTVFSFNMLGDALRDALDPRLRGSR